MADKKRTGRIEIKLKHGAFTGIFRRFKVDAKKYEGLDFTDITALRQLLSNEKARMLYILQHKKPKSIYELAKILKRDFKSVRKDVELLKQFGLVSFKSQSRGKRKMLQPILNLDRIELVINL